VFTVIENFLTICKLESKKDEYVNLVNKITALSFRHGDNSICHNDCKVTDELDNLKLDHVHHPLYSQDLSPCEFWIFGILKKTIKDRIFQRGEEIMIAVNKVWDNPASEDLQSVCFSWIE
jgi:hypothetical protein